LEIDVTEEEKQKIVDLWEQGMTGKEIGEIFGVSRCSILGLINRMRNNGYEFKRPFERNRSIRENIIKAKKEKIFMVPKAHKKPKVIKPPKTTKPPKLIIKKEKPIDTSTDIMGLKSNSCRYPISPDDAVTMMFCGRPQEHGSYCKEHGAICYYPSRHQSSIPSD
jgi:hypothetical protein